MFPSLSYDQVLALALLGAAAVLWSATLLVLWRKAVLRRREAEMALIRRRLLVVRRAP